MFGGVPQPQTSRDGPKRPETAVFGVFVVPPAVAAYCSIMQAMLERASILYTPGMYDVEATAQYHQELYRDMESPISSEFRRLPPVLGLTVGLRSFTKKSLCGARLSHQGVLTTVLEHTRAAYYGKNFVPQ